MSRSLHPLAWWIWAGGLAIAASRTTDPLLLLVIIAVAGFAVAVRGPASPWSRSYAVFLRLGLFVIAVRLLLFALFAGTGGTHILVTLPSLHLPSALAGLRIGGPITVEGLLAAVYDGLRLAAVLACVGAANSLSSPRRLLKSMPGAMFAAGVAVTVALSAAPQAVATLGRLRRARRMRGRADTGPRAVRGLLIPTLEGALDDSVELAAALDARGFGRRPQTGRRTVRAAAGCTTAGLLAVVASLYAVAGGGAPAVLGWPLLAAGVTLLSAGLVLGSRGARTRHRPDVWRIAESAVAGSGLVAALLVATAPFAAVQPSTYPPVMPSLPLLPLLGLLVALTPAAVRPRRTHARALLAPLPIRPARRAA